MIVNFLQKIQTAIPSEEDLDTSQVEYYPGLLPRPVPDYIKTISPEELAVEYLTFIQTEFPDTDMSSYGRDVFDLFLRSKGVDNRFELPLEIDIKVRKARGIIYMEREQERDREEQKRMEQERAELPSYIDSFHDWLSERGLTKARLMDVNRFATEYELDLLGYTVRDILEKTQSRLEDERNERAKQEREGLSSLVDQCIDWARANGLNRLTKADCETYLIEYDLDVLRETKDRLYAISNTKLKSK